MGRYQKITASTICARQRQDLDASPVQRSVVFGLRPSPQALFPEATDILDDERTQGQSEAAEVRLRALGFEVRVNAAGAWEISWPGSALLIWRYTVRELCHFTEFQAIRYVPVKNTHEPQERVIPCSN